MGVEWDQLLQQVVNALSLGSIYALVAIGLGVVFSIMRLVNFAHGELLTIAGFTLYGLAGHVAWPLAFAGAIAAAALAAVLIERIAFRPVRGSAPSTLLLTSFALSAIVQTALLVLFGGTAKSIDFPSWVQSSFAVGDVRIRWLDVVTVLGTAGVLFGLTRFLRDRVSGLALRAAAESFSVTRLMGIKADRVVTTAFLLSGLLAGVAGILWLANSATVMPTSGFEPMIKGFVAAVIGGIGSLGGAALAGVLLGCVEVLLRNVLPESALGWTDGFVFFVVILIFLVKPNGLFAREERLA